MSPFFLVFGRQPNLPLDIVHQGMRATQDENEPLPMPQRAAQHASKIVNKLADAFQAVKKAWKNDIDHRSRAYSGIAPDDFKVGAKCLVFTPSRRKNVSDKLVSGYKGPYIISEKISDILYRVKADPSFPNNPKPPKGIIGLSRMKLVNSRDNNLQQDSNDNEEDRIETSPDQSQNDDQDSVNFPHEYEALFDMNMAEEQVSNSSNHENNE